MSEIQKCPKLVREGGGSAFFKNVPKVGTLSKISRISILMAPLRYNILIIIIAITISTNLH